MKEKIKILGIIALAAIFALSMISCDDPKECGHVYGPWTLTDGEILRVCTNPDDLDCTDVEKFNQSYFYQTWTEEVASGTAQVLKISKDKFELATGGADADGNCVFNYVFTISEEWVAVENNNPATSGDTIKANFPLGYKLTGTTTTNTTSINNFTEIEIFFNIAEDGMTIHWKTPPGATNEYSTRIFK